MSYKHILIAAIAAGGALKLLPVDLAAQTPPALRLTRNLRIDAGEQDLSPIGFIAVAPNGTIVISQAQDKLIRFFDTSGKARGTFGKKGQGPGEFESLGRLSWIADTLVAGDIIRRFTLIGPNQKLVRTVRWAPTVTNATKPGSPSPVFVFPVPYARYANGDQLLFTTLGRGSAVPDWVPAAVSRLVIRTDSTGAFKRLIGSQAEENCVEWFADGSGNVTIPYCSKSKYAVSPDGNFIALLHVDSSIRPTYVLTMIRSNGDTTFRTQYLYQPVTISKAARDAAIASARQFGPDAIAALSKAKIPESYPPVATILLSGEGTTWMELTTTTGPRRWHVIDPDGHVIGRVDLPREVRLQVTSRHTVWGTQTDTDGLQHIVRYSVSR